MAIGAALIVGAAVVATVATGGVACFAYGAAIGAAKGAVSGAIGGAISGAIESRIATGSWDGALEAAIDGAADGFLGGAIGWSHQSELLCCWYTDSNGERRCTN